MSHRWGAKISAAAHNASHKVASTATNVKDDISRKKHATKDAEFIEIQKEFDEKSKLITQLTADIVSFVGSAEAILIAQQTLAADLLKLAPDRSPMALLCKQQLDTVEQMIKCKTQGLDKQLTATFTDPVNAYQGQYREISDRIRERNRRETDMDKLMTERDKFKEKGDPRLAGTETKLEAATTAYNDINEELKNDIPVLLSQAESFFQPLILLLILNQSTFWSSMSQYTTALAQRVDQSQAYVPEIQQAITPKPQSAITKKYSSITSSPWDRTAAQPAIAYGITPTPAIASSPYNQPPPGANSYASPVPPPHGNTPAYGVQPGYGTGHTVPPTPGYGTGHNVPPTPGYGTGHNVPPTPEHGGHTPPVGYGAPPTGGAPYTSGNPFGGAPPQSQVPSSTPAQNPFSQPPVSGSNPFSGPRPIPTAPSRAPTLPQAQGQWDFNGQDDTELSFRSGDIITVHSQQGDWWNGELNGKKGLFPANYVKLL